MASGISIGKNIYKLLSGSDNLKAIVSNKIYPLVAAEGVTFPFVTFTVDTVTPDNNYKYSRRDRVNFTVACIGEDYSITTDIAEAVRSSLDVDSFAFQSAEDDYQNNAFIKVLKFEVIWEH